MYARPISVLLRFSNKVFKSANHDPDLTDRSQTRGQESEANARLAASRAQNLSFQPGRACQFSHCSTLDFRLDKGSAKTRRLYFLEGPTFFPFYIARNWHLEGRIMLKDTERVSSSSPSLGLSHWAREFASSPKRINTIQLLTKKHRA